jgi:hypothetical protein
MLFDNAATLNHRALATPEPLDREPPRARGPHQLFPLARQVLGLLEQTKVWKWARRQMAEQGQAPVRLQDDDGCSGDCDDLA